MPPVSWLAAYALSTLDHSVNIAFCACVFCPSLNAMTIKSKSTAAMIFFPTGTRAMICLSTAAGVGQVVPTTAAAIASPAGIASVGEGC